LRAPSPRLGKTVYDPGCGTAGMLIEADVYMLEQSKHLTGDEIQLLKQRTFYGREKENLIYPIALANLVLHGIDEPNIWHGNTLTGQEIYGGLFEGALCSTTMSHEPAARRQRGQRGADRFRLQDWRDASAFCSMSSRAEGWRHADGAG
jgi:hypothetical protein